MSRICEGNDRKFLLERHKVDENIEPIQPGTYIPFSYPISC